jgi:hypothetical protein
MDYDFIDRYNELEDTIDAMIRADKKSLLGDDAWLQVSSGDIHTIENLGDKLVISGSTWTNTTGGSYEYWTFKLAKSDLELFQTKQRLGAGA